MAKEIQIGKSDVKTTPLGLGANAVGGYNLFPDLQDQDGLDLVHAAIDNGIKLIDTAYVYGLGHSEELVGSAIKDYDRHNITIATKGAQDFSTGDQVIRNDPAFLTDQVDKSLKRLGTDYIDIYYIHFPDHDTPKAEAVGALEKLKEAGKIRAIGVSNFSLDQVKEANADGYVDIVEDEFSLLHQDNTKELLTYLKDHHISFVPYFPLASGLLTGKYTGPVKFPADDIRSQMADFKAPRYDEALNAINKLRPIADGHHVTIAQLVLAWYIANPLVGMAIPGAKHAKQAAANAKALDIELSQEEYDQIDSAFAYFKANKGGKSLPDPD